MSGVEELRARLAKLSTEIDRHKEVVRKLERDKRLVQQQLNAVLDPVARLPLEISSEIFLQCLPALPALPEPRAEGVPMVLLNICNAWTAIALSIPTLWAAIHIAHPRAEGIKKILPTWIHRAGNRSLSLSLGAKFDEGVAAIIWRHGQQLKHLELSYDKEHHDDEDSDEDSDGDSGEDGINLFRESTGPLPLLETLTIHGSNIGHSTPVSKF
ncbi:hypothetical protein B0H13DRAFT_393976 [Mycena leptocephala]|nr:hypothetical protein B0H13DRAFT_393976 [Mycena leptocephala]